MKKTTLLNLFMAFSLCIYAKQTISFESEEGYSFENINSQHGWLTTGDGAGGFITNQVVSNEQSTDGIASLKIQTEATFPTQSNPFVGANYIYPTPISFTDAVFSADIYIDDTAAGKGFSNDYIFGLINATEGVFITYIRFSFDRNILVLVDNGPGATLEDTTIDWEPQTWLNARMEIKNNNAEFFINDISIYQSTVATSDSDIELVRFAHDNNAGFAHLDNFITNDKSLSVKEIDKNVFTHSYNTLSKTLNLKSSNLSISNIEMYSILGQNVLSKSLKNSEESIDISSLKDGIYIAKIDIGNRTKTVKFIKN